MNECMHEWSNERTNKRMNEYQSINERTNKWPHEQITSANIVQDSKNMETYPQVAQLATHGEQTALGIIQTVAHKKHVISYPTKVVMSDKYVIVYFSILFYLFEGRLYYPVSGGRRKNHRNTHKVSPAHAMYNVDAAQVICCMSHDQPHQPQIEQLGKKEAPRWFKLPSGKLT